MAEEQEARRGVVRARVAGFGIVLALVVAGTTAALVAEQGSVWRELGLAFVSGGVVGAAFVSIESILTAAADKRSHYETLVAQLSSTVDLNGIDLSNRDLSGLYLPGRALVAARLVGTNLDESKLYFGDFRRANFRGASLRGADLSGSTLAGADLSDADLSSATLCDVDLSDACLEGAILRDVVLTDGRLQGANLAGAELHGATVRTSYLQGARLAQANLAGAEFVDNEFDDSTEWPPSFDVPERIAVVQADFATSARPGAPSDRAALGRFHIEPAGERRTRSLGCMRTA